MLKSTADKRTITNVADPFLYKGNAKRGLKTKAKVAFTLGQNTPRKMVVLLRKKTFFIYQIAKSTACYAA